MYGKVHYRIGKAERLIAMVMLGKDTSGLSSVKSWKS